MPLKKVEGKKAYDVRMLPGQDPQVFDLPVLERSKQVAPWIPFFFQGQFYYSTFEGTVYRASVIVFGG